MPYNSFDDYPMSWKPVLDRSHRSLYMALVQQLEADIAAGILKPGTKLPPQRELADYLDINVSTVSKAFKHCELKGLLTATVGSGTFVAYSALTNKALPSPDLQPRYDVIDMGVAQPDDSANAALFEMAQELLRNEGAASLFSFHAQGEVEWQKDAAVRLIELCGHHTNRDCILFANGAQNALSSLLPALFKRGSKIAVDDHTYPGIKSAAAMFGIKLVPISTGPSGIDVADLERTCQTQNISGLYLVSTCHTPTTATIPLDRRRAIAETLRRHDMLLIEDGTYHLLQPGIPSISDMVPERSAYIATMSKIIAPGLRTAFISVPLSLKQAVSDALYSLNLTVVPMMAELSCRVIASGQFEGIVETHRRCTRLRSELVHRYLPHRICLGGDTDIYRWLLLPGNEDSVLFEQRCLQRGLQVHAAQRFAVGKTPPAHAVRLCICSPRTMEELEQGLKILTELTGITG